MTATDYPVGATIWQELKVTGTEGLESFYSAVLGWTLETEGASGRWLKDGAVVAGLRVDAELAADQVGWITYLGAENLADAVSRAVAAGATVQNESAALAVAGDAVELTDPFGAWFGLAVLAAETAVPVSTALGYMSLVDPTNHDLDAQIAFQDALFPGQENAEVQEHIHFFRNADGLALRGASEVVEEARAFLPPHWLPWFNVADQSEATATAGANGGTVNTSDNVASFGVWGVVVDPSGGVFKTLQVAGEAL